MINEINFIEVVYYKENEMNWINIFILYIFYYLFFYLKKKRNFFFDIVGSFYNLNLRN